MTLFNGYIARHLIYWQQHCITFCWKKHLPLTYWLAWWAYLIPLSNVFVLFLLHFSHKFNQLYHFIFISKAEMGSCSPNTCNIMSWMYQMLLPFQMGKMGNNNPLENTLDLGRLVTTRKEALGTLWPRVITRYPSSFSQKNILNLGRHAHWHVVAGIRTRDLLTCA